MKLSFNWLKEFVAINKTANAIAEDLNLKSVAVEEVIHEVDDKIIVGKVTKINVHPNADRLSIVTINTGKSDHNIVCGAKNFKVGDIVPLATIGAKIGDIHIAEAEIRGIKSYGMLCSERELALGDDHSGIKILPDTYKEGGKLNEYIKSDSLFDIEITPNRGDLLSHLGISRELAAIYNKQIKYPEILSSFKNQNVKLEVNIENTDLCPQYYALEICGVKIGPSPKWLKDRLTFLGIKTINNVVDVTNYVMLELGQPLHAFDAGMIKDKEIIVRQSGEMEKIVTIDANERLLPKESLVIADKEKILAIAGIMGGKTSEVTSHTKNIIIESAEFDRRSIRRTSKALALSTDASYRFERGIDSGCVEFALRRAAFLVSQIAGGNVKKISQKSKVKKNNQIEMDYKKINSLLGLNLKKNEVRIILTSLGFDIVNNKVKVPLYRHDVNIWQDLAEEVGRIYGYNKIKKNKMIPTKSYKKSEYFIKENIKDILFKLGFTEIYNYIYLSSKDVDVACLNKKELMEIANPLQIDNKYLRNSLFPGLLKCISKNPSFDAIAIFEFGNVFTHNNEICNLGLASAGKNAKEMINSAIEKISLKCNARKNDFKFSEIKNDTLSKYKIKKHCVYIAEISISKLFQYAKFNDKELNLNLKKQDIFYRVISQFPPVSRDIAFLINKSISSSIIQENIVNTSDKILLVTLFDEFTSEKIGIDKKNVAFHILLQNMQKSMTDSEANEIINKIVNNIENKFNAKLRS